VSDSVQYIDVGLKLEVEPTIFPNDEVSIKMALEVSSLVSQITSKDGTTVYQIGTRNAATVLRLKDGETQILGGLINDNDSKSANRLPGLGDFPILGRLFSSHRDNTEKTELVLSITPRLVRGLSAPLTVPSKFWSGTENNPGVKLQALSNTISDTAAANTQESLAVASAAPARPASAQQPNASISPFPTVKWKAPGEVKAGSTFKLLLNVSSQQPIMGFPLQVKYDPAIFEAVGTVPGSFMTKGGGTPEVTKRIEGESGTIFLTQNRSGKQGASGNGDLLEVELRALKPVENSPVTVLPATPVGAGNKALAPTKADTVGVTVTP
jgi:general secretion pathway protein D